MHDNSREYWARQFGLPVSQIHSYEELTAEQKGQAQYQFGAGTRGYENYIYAVKRDGSLVSRREPMANS